MSKLLNRVRRGRTHHENGSSAAEYGLVITGVAAMTVTLVFALGSLTGGALADACDKLDGDSNGTCETVTSEPAPSSVPPQN